MGLEAILIFVLILANGVFSMSEIAVVAARRSSLQQRADRGDRRSRIALKLAQDPNAFLSTVQIGITVIGILAGAFGGLTISEKLAAVLLQFPSIAPYAPGLAFGIVVLVISYLSLILGELVPKRVALANPEGLATAVAPMMNRIARVASPLVRFLSLSTDFVFRLIPIRRSEEGTVTEEEIKSLIEQGTLAGVVDETEQTMVEGVFRLGDRLVVELMTPRMEVVWIDAADSAEEILETVRRHRFSEYPVCDGSLDRILGTVHVRELFTSQGEGSSLRSILREASQVPESTAALKVMETLRDSSVDMAFVIDEHGGVEGLVTMADLVGSIVRDFSKRLPGSDSDAAVQRDDGTWLVDGRLPIRELEDLLDVSGLRTHDDLFTTIGGLLMTHLGRVPSVSDKIEVGGVGFEVVDMDGKRVDKVLVTKGAKPEEAPEG